MKVLSNDLYKEIFNYKNIIDIFREVLNPSYKLQNILLKGFQLRYTLHHTRIGKWLVVPLITYLVYLQNVRERRGSFTHSKSFPS